MPLVFRKGSFGTGGPSRARATPLTATPRPLFDSSLYIGLEDGVDWLGTEDTSDPFILE
jgi:hypothetical protein